MASLTWRDRLDRVLLLAVVRTLGVFSGQVRTVGEYGLDLIDRGAGSEFRALVRHRLQRALGKAGPRPAGKRRRNTVSIDARFDRLTDGGTVVRKTSFAFPGAEAPLLVSIVIPCFNYGRYLEEAVESARRQTVASREIVIVDDGSTEAQTQAVLDRLARFHDVRIIRQENQGLPSARNRGIASSQGEYVCCLDADDVLVETYLEQTIAVLESDRSVGFAYSWVRFFGDTDEIWRTEDFDPERALIGNFTSVSAVFRRDDCQVLGGYSQQMQGGFEDWEFWIRLACLGRRGRVVAQPLFRHRRHGTTMTHSAKAMQADLRARMRDLAPEFYRDASLRRRLTLLAPPPRGSASPFGTLATAGVIGTDPRPGLLVVVAGLLHGGAHTLLCDILGQLKQSWRITVVTTDAEEHPLEDRLRRHVEEIVHMRGFLPTDDWLPFVDHLLTTRKTSAVLSSDSLWFLQHVEQIRASRPALNIANLLHNHVPTSCFRSAVRNSPFLNHHIVVSDTIATALERAGVPAKQVVEISNGVDVEGAFNPAGIDRDVARQAFRRPRASAGSVADRSLSSQHGERPLLLWIGRMSEEKRPELFVELVASVARTTPVEGLMIGEGPLAEAIDRTIVRESLSDVLSRRPFMPREDVRSAYAAADLLVLTSTVEGMPLVVLEALSMGCPVASTRVGNVARVIEHGVNGYLTAVDEPLAQIECVTNFVASRVLRTTMRSEARARAGAGAHTLERMSAEYARILT